MKKDQLLKHYHFDVYELAMQKGIGWVSAQTQISYLFPAFPMEEVVIQTRLISVTEKGLLLEALMWNADKTILKAVMWVKFVHYNIKAQRSQFHSEELKAFFQQIVCPLPVETSFEERVNALKSPIK